MKTASLAGTAVFLLAVLVGCGGPSLSPLPEDATVLAFGDSLTYGTGAPHDAAYPAVLAQLTGLTVVNAGVPGEVSAAGRERLPAALDEHKPDLVLLVHGGNDTLRKLPPEDTRANLRAMVESGRRAGARVAMLGVPGRSFTLSAPDFYEEVARELAVPIDSGTLPRLLRDRSLKSDPVHLNAAGYRRLAEAVQALLVEAGALP
ncbi:MAG: arylesterase [Pseudohaliea sp.]